ncbi:MAG TPA: hypothetical protein VNO70_03895 [Blastocatellia bacterium]|nr:hypothetical protein [Blastocatellia bacterium]
MRLRKMMALLMMTLFVGATAVLAATNDPVTGKYEGVAKSPQLGELPLTVNLKNEGGKLSGAIETPNGPAQITSGTFSPDGKVTMKFDAGGNEGVVNAMLKDGIITGTWTLAGMEGTLELKKAVGAMPAQPAQPAASAPATGATGAAAGDPISGEWDATADANGQTIPFVLKLKLDGEKVTGESVSDQGATQINNGAWKAEKLSFQLDTPFGLITLTGTVKEGKMTGDYEVSGQTGKWEAKKKK